MLIENQQQSFRFKWKNILINSFLDLLLMILKLLKLTRFLSLIFKPDWLEKNEIQAWISSCSPRPQAMLLVWTPKIFLKLTVQSFENVHLKVSATNTQVQNLQRTISPLLLQNRMLQTQLFYRNRWSTLGKVLLLLLRTFQIL